MNEQNTADDCIRRNPSTGKLSKWATVHNITIKLRPQMLKQPSPASACLLNAVILRKFIHIVKIAHVDY